MNKKITVFLDPDVVEDVFGEDTPFNLKRDIKNISSSELDFIISYVGDQIILPPLPPPRAKLCGNNNIFILKIRCSSLENNKGKRSGYRVIVLVDKINLRSIILSIYAKNSKENLSYYESEKIKKLLKNYCESI